MGIATFWQISEIASTLGDAVKQGIIGPDGAVNDIKDAYVADITSRIECLLGRADRRR